MLEKTLESPLDCKEIKPANPKRNHPLIFIGRTDAEAEAPVLKPPDAKNRLIRKDPGTTELLNNHNILSQNKNYTVTEYSTL